ncbi:hypothetical protein PPERSA_03313 [Pseudocohnilembus persalinus]|uniref:Uncharacterized protein n=1 Tax=Pseudocohnilembus persalinus TaxID=266149 RepID=A0A0V0Q8B9_PSEPJ|nr:hypothetical protein PPERSA_03313 [Pseudocohnilembus persalinus]|eukprot:KRW98482.1 hypothetical protein PPERSA_03313 [Pseudocohnilembus persalinus]
MVNKINQPLSLPKLNSNFEKNKSMTNIFKELISDCQNILKSEKNSPRKKQDKTNSEREPKQSIIISAENQQESQLSPQQKILNYQLKQDNNKLEKIKDLQKNTDKLYQQDFQRMDSDLLQRVLQFDQEQGNLQFLQKQEKDKFNSIQQKCQIRKQYVLNNN